ncbi:hypothetical protein C8R44DRAFT_740452 [Mycena epipterygia]|nr:hypothetical protein C8R44DRAFT_740452 [Mycena epipterygia]
MSAAGRRPSFSAASGSSAGEWSHQRHTRIAPGSGVAGTGGGTSSGYTGPVVGVPVCVGVYIGLRLYLCLSRQGHWCRCPRLSSGLRIRITGSTRACAARVYGTDRDADIIDFHQHQHLFDPDTMPKWQ